MIRLLDVVISFFSLLFFSPFGVLFSVLVYFSSRGGVLFRQKRIGQNGVPFIMYKFRTMYLGSDKSGNLTIGDNDSRITKIGHFLRKYKLDEFPQFLNVLKGDMSIVGPRPEVEKYVSLYTPNQLKILQLKPGITDYASIAYRNESAVLSTSSDPETFYLDKVMPHKLELNKILLDNFSVLTYFRVIAKTFVAVVSKS
jgi:lipopolysaccharide/colanic/teichoic acid biosynthesis glycosyltransferase